MPWVIVSSNRSGSLTVSVPAKQTDCRQENTRRPLESAEFVDAPEHRTERRLAPQKGARPLKPVADPRQEAFKFTQRTRQPARTRRQKGKNQYNVGSVICFCTLRHVGQHHPSYPLPRLRLLLAGSFTGPMRAK